MVTKQDQKTNSLSATLQMLLDPTMNLDDRRMLLAQLARDDSSESSQVLQELFSLANENVAKQEYFKKRKQLDELMQMIKDGPLRLGTYLGPAPGPNGQATKRVHVLLENGDTAFPAIGDPKLIVDPKTAEPPACGDPILLDAQARAVIARGPASCCTGEVAELKQRIGDHRVRVSLNDLSSEVFRISEALKIELDSGTVQLGAGLLVCSRRRMAFEALPQQKGVSHYKFLDQGPLQDVDIQRDIGHPHPFIEELLEHVRIEMTQPELNRKYGVRPMQTRLLKGLTGTGKTLSILGLINSIYRVMSEVTGAPVEALPQRVMRMRTSRMLNKYLGESDKAQDRFYDEVIQLGRELFVWEGREWMLPVIARCEEIDALARARHGAEDVMGRIQTTALERLDHLAGDLGDTLCIMLFTTNVPEICDQAFIRRAGGQIVGFGRIGRRQFQAILSKKIGGRPMHPDLSQNRQQAERRLAHEVTDWMFSPNGHDPGQVEVTFAGSAKKDVKYRRDLLTGSVVDLSVQQACAEARQVERQGMQTPGLTTEMVLAAFDRQIRGMCEQITEFNAHDYLPLPEGARVASVRRIEQPAVPTFHLDRR